MITVKLLRYNLHMWLRVGPHPSNTSLQALDIWVLLTDNTVSVGEEVLYNLRATKTLIKNSSYKI